jgi:hypothetical protein
MNDFLAWFGWILIATLIILLITRKIEKLSKIPNWGWIPVLAISAIIIARNVHITVNTNAEGGQIDISWPVSVTLSTLGILVVLKLITKLISKRQ